MSWDQEALVDGPVPLWHQIAERLRGAIERGEFLAGDALPSESQINARFGVSRTTARASLDRLKEDGLISRKSGKGSIVLASRVEQQLDRLSSFSDDMRRRGLEPSYRTDSVRRMPLRRRAAEAFGVEPGLQAVRVRRRLLADDMPIGLSDSWIAPEVLALHELPDRTTLDKGSLYVWLADVCGAQVAEGNVLIGASAATARQGKSLGVEHGTPLLVARRTCRSYDGSPIEYATVHYRPDRYHFRIDLVNS